MARPKLSCPVCGTPNAASAVERKLGDTAWYSCDHCGSFGIGGGLDADSAALQDVLDRHPDRRQRLMKRIRDANARRDHLLINARSLNEALGETVGS